MKKATPFLISKCYRMVLVCYFTLMISMQKVNLRRIKNIEGFYHPKFQERQQAAGEIKGPFDPQPFSTRLPADVAAKLRALGSGERTAWMRRVLTEAARKEL